jgi:hypothetical protein
MAILFGEDTDQGVNKSGYSTPPGCKINMRMGKVGIKYSALTGAKH